MIRPTCVCLLLFSVLACGLPPSRRPEQIHGVVEGVAADAWLQLRNGQPIAALRAARAVDRLVPERELEAALRVELSPAELAHAERPGAWRGARELQERPVWERVALWLPDRVRDVFDLVSVELTLGLGFRFDVHATQVLKFASGGSKGVGIGWHEERSLGLSLFRRADWWGQVQQYRYLSLNGTRAGLVASDLFASLPGPDDPYYDDLGDRWAVGGEAHLIVLGAGVDVHPVQFWDLRAGFVGFDPWDDDMARTRPYDPDQQTRLRLEALHEVLLDLAGREAYAAWLVQREQNAAPRAETP